MSSTAVPAPVKRTRKGSRHDKSGCLTCRHRRKKCIDNTLPACGTCRRLNLKCVRQPIRNVITEPTIAEADPPSSATRQNAPKASQDTFIDLPSSHVDPLPSLSAEAGDSRPSHLPMKRHAMQYYISVLTQLLTASSHFNSFLSAFLPMAMESTALYESLLAFASGHISMSEESYKVVALESRSIALKKLSEAISRPSDDITRHETNVAACLTLVIGDVGTSDFAGWYAHLVGAKQIIVSAKARSSNDQTLHGPQVFKQSTEGRWILRNFAYHDIIGSITMQRGPLLDASYLDGITDTVDSYVGVATGLLSHVAQITCLDDKTKIDDGMIDQEKQRRRAVFHSTCATLEKSLQAWTCPPNCQEHHDSLAYAFRAAALILVYRLARKRLQEDDSEGSASALWVREILRSKIRTQVYEIINQADAIPSGVMAESALLFPLFIAGGEATEQGQMDFVATRLEATLQKRKFQNIAKALQVLRDLWSLRQAQNCDTVDWTTVLEASGGSLLLT